MFLIRVQNHDSVLDVCKLDELFIVFKKRLISLPSVMQIYNAFLPDQMNDNRSVNSQYKPPISISPLFKPPNSCKLKEMRNLSALLSPAHSGMITITCLL